jgi:ATP-dependent Lon protease
MAKLESEEDRLELNDAGRGEGSSDQSATATDGSAESELIRAGDVLPPMLHLLPLFERPFFPRQVLPMVILAKPWLETITAVAETPHKMLGLVLVRTDSPVKMKPRDFRAIGTVVRMHNPARQDDRIQFMAEGLERFQIRNWISRERPYLVEVDYPKTPEEDGDKTRAYGMAILNTIKELLPLNPVYSDQLQMFLAHFGPNQPAPFADFAASLTTAKKEELQDVLETFALIPRMEKVLLLLKKELDVAKLQAEIREGVQERMTEQQRKFFLREQLKEIQKELGIAKDDRTAEVDRFKERLESLEPSEEAKKRIDEELEKMSVLEIGSPEYAVTRNYLDWMTSLPWGQFSDDKLDIDEARAILDRDHDGLDDVKDRIIEFLAVGAYKGEVGGSILLLVGPPGVGKTSIGRSVAEALGREFYRFSLGGMRDEAEIKGHRRTYIGAMPGKFIQAIKAVGVSNPIIMLDEVDKIGASFQGDPASALLEVLDPEQNVDFLDHYLDVRYDLSKILFICTANQLDTIPAPLLDRMENIHLAGYIAKEKVAIARNHLWPKQLEKGGVDPEKVELTDAALEALIEGYAREAGVRNLEKQLGRIVRKAVLKLLKNVEPPLRIERDVIEEYLGKPTFRKESPITGVGVVTGLAWTAMGGDTLNVEATRVHQKSRGFKLTGKLGEVMKESAEIAYSYVVSHAVELGVDPSLFDDAFIHLHVPAGATPKDGPSAGITMAMALLSLARDERVDRPLAMTGELTLTGRVLPVGGIREKIIAARRSGITEVVLPAGNRKDFDELPQHLRDGLKAEFVETYPDAARVAFKSLAVSGES